MVSTLKVTKIQTPNSDSDVISLDASSGNITVPKPISFGGTVSGSGFDLLATSSGDGVANFDITTGFSTTYDTYFLTYVAQPASDGVDAYLRVFTDVGTLSNTDATGMFGRELLPMDGGGTQNTDNSSLYFGRLNRYGIRSHVNMGIQGWAYILNRNSSTIMTSISGQSNSIQTGTSNHNLTVWGATQTTDVNRIIIGVRFVFSSGDVNNGEMKLYGVK